MTNKPFTIKEDKYLECDPEVQFINQEQDILDLMGSAYPLRKYIIYQSNLNPDFFDLSSGIAGGILQKIVNYHIKAAFIVDYKSIKSERFKELIYETNTNEEYRFFESEEEGLRWLLEE